MIKSLSNPKWLRRSLQKVKLRSLLIWIHRRVFKEKNIFFHFFPIFHHQRWNILKVLGQRSSKKRRHPGAPFQESLQVSSSAAGVPLGLLSDPSEFFFFCAIARERFSLSASSADVRLSSEGRLRTARPGVLALHSGRSPEVLRAEGWNISASAFIDLHYLFPECVPWTSSNNVSDFDWYSTTQAVKCHCAFVFVGALHHLSVFTPHKEESLSADVLAFPSPSPHRLMLIHCKSHPLFLFMS